MKFRFVKFALAATRTLLVAEDWHLPEANFMKKWKKHLVATGRPFFCMKNEKWIFESASLASPLEMTSKSVKTKCAAVDNHNLGGGSSQFLFQTQFFLHSQVNNSVTSMNVMPKLIVGVILLSAMALSVTALSIHRAFLISKQRVGVATSRLYSSTKRTYKKRRDGAEFGKSSTDLSWENYEFG